MCSAQVLPLEPNPDVGAAPNPDEVVEPKPEGAADPNPEGAVDPKPAEDEPNPEGAAEPKEDVCWSGLFSSAICEGREDMVG